MFLSVAINFYTPTVGKFHDFSEMGLMRNIQAQTMQERDLEASRLNSLGVEKFQKAKFKEALTAFEPAYLIFPETNKFTRQSAMLNQIGTI